MSVKKLVIGTGIFAAVIFVCMVALFFIKLNTTISDFSGADAPISNQIYYNFFHGRPFQLSFYTEFSSQFTNVKPYINVLVFHSYFLSTPMIALFYVFLPGINTMHAVFIILTYAGFAFFTFKIIQRLSPSNCYLKSILAFSVFLLSGYLRQAVLCGYHIILCAPVILAAYYFLISKKRMAFLLAVVSLCLIADELAAFLLTFLPVLFIFEKEERRAVFSGLVFTIGYFILWNFILQPIIRYDLPPVASGIHSMFLLRLYKMLKFLPSVLSSLSAVNIAIVLSGFYLPAIAAILIYRFFGAARKPNWPKILSFAFLAPLIFWIYGIYSLSGRHLIPVLAMAYLSFLLLLSYIKFDWHRKLTVPGLASFFAATALFVAVNILVMAPALPHSLRCYIGKITHLNPRFEICKRDGIDVEIASNKEAIKKIRQIPASKSVVFWGNYSITGFISDRNDIWLFPMQYDLADFLVIQKDAGHSPFVAKDLSELDYKKPGVQDSFYEDMSKPISAGVVEKLKRELVDKANTHRVYYDSGHVMILERLEHHKFYMPRSSIGFGWLESAPKVFNRKGI